MLLLTIRLSSGTKEKRKNNKNKHVLKEDVLMGRVNRF